MNLRISAWLSVATAIGLSGCGSSDSNAPTPSDPTKPVKLVLIPSNPGPLFLGLTLSLRAVGINADGDTLPTVAIAWTSSDPQNVPVTSNGIVTGLSAATATITASSAALSTSIVVKVVRLLTFSISPFDTTLDAGQTITYLVSGRDATGQLYQNLPVAWQVNFNASLVTNPGNGQITALETDGGDVRLRLVLGSLFAEVWITVAPAPVAQVVLTPEDLWVHQVATPHYALLSQNGSTLHNRPVTWSSSDSSIITPLANGTLTGLKAGTATITLNAGTAQGSIMLTVQALPLFTAIADGGRACGLTSQGDVYCWPRYDTLPALVSNGIKFSQISGSGHICGVSMTGEGFCWGASNGAGQLGNGTTNSSAIPVPVAGGLAFRQITTGGEYSCGVTTAGKGYCWGLNSWGTLGDGTTNHSSVPVPISGSLTFSQLTASRVVSRTTCGITTSNQAYCWGNNEDGQFGTGDSAQSTTPRLVSGGVSWQSISINTFHTCGIDTSNVAYCWGPNVYGGLGDGSLVSTAAPHPVLGGTYSAVAVGYLYTCGVGSSGTLKCWGWNESFQLGDGTQTQRPVPVATSNLTFSQVSAVNNGGCGLTDNGKVLCWGGSLHTPTLLVGQD